MNTLSVYFKELKNRNSSNEETVALIKLARAGCAKSKERVIKDYLLLVVKIAREYSNNGVPLEDLICEGNAGLVVALDKFDLERGAPFSSCAKYWIKQGIIREGLMKRRLIRLPENVSELIRSDRYDGVVIKEMSLDLPNEDGNSLSENIADITETDDIYAREEKALLDAKIEKVLSFIKGRDAEIVKAFFGIGYKEQLDINQVAEKFDLTTTRINQIVKSSLKSMKVSHDSLPGVKIKEIKIIKAFYGIEDCYKDVTDKVISLHLNNEHIKSSNKLGGDPCFGIEKHLLIEYTCNDIPKKKVFKEGTMVDL